MSLLPGQHLLQALQLQALHLLVEEGPLESAGLAAAVIAAVLAAPLRPDAVVG